jgi:hypothetical protein
MRLFRPVFCLVAALLVTAGAADMALTQEYQISGAISSASDGSPLVGASVEVKGSSTRALTSATGAYEITDRIAGDTLVFSMPGFYSIQVPIIRVVGIRSSPLITLVGPVESGRNVINVSLQPLTNEPGRMVVRLESRSGGVVANIEYDSRPGPLYLLDGVVVDAGTFNALNPQTIESVRVLRGADVTRFGEAARNGVIEVITRSEDRSEP